MFEEISEMRKTLICATAATALSTAFAAPVLAQEDDGDDARRLGAVTVTA